MKKQKRTEKITVFLGAAIVMCAVTGCGNTDGEETGDVIRIESSSEDNSGQMQQEEERNDGEREKPEDGQEYNNVESERTEDDQGAETDVVLKEIESDTELSGDVKSIGEDSMTVSEIHNYVEEDQGKAAEVGVSYAIGSPDDELITVYFSENTQFIIRNVKNGGVNGDSDVEDEAGSVSNIQEGKTVNMTGSYEGADFYADQVIIYNFI